MKKKLLYLASIVLFSATSINAQTTTWDFGNNTSKVNGGAVVTTDWGLNSTGIGTSEIVKSSLGLFPIATNVNFGAITSGSAGAGQFSDDYLAPNRFQTNGSGFATGAANTTPTQRYLYFNVSGAATVKVWFKSGNSSSTRSVIVSDNVTVLGTESASASGAIVTASLPAAGKYYVYGDAAVNIYKIEVTGATVNTPALSTNSFQQESSVVVYANDGAINVSNVTSATKVSVYSVLGSLVKSIETSGEASIEINSGVYIVKAQSSEGTKTAKVIVQ